MSFIFRIALEELNHLKRAKMAQRTAGKEVHYRHLKKKLGIFEQYEKKVEGKRCITYKYKCIKICVVMSSIV